MPPARSRGRSGVASGRSTRGPPPTTCTLGPFVTFVSGRLCSLDLRASGPFVLRGSQLTPCLSEPSAAYPFKNQQNALASIRNRVVNQVPRPWTTWWSRLTRAVINHLVYHSDGRPLEPLPLRKWVERYPLRQRLALLRASREPPKALVRAFIKMEPACPLKDPRNISPRDASYTVALGPAIAAVERLLASSPLSIKGLDVPRRDSKMERLLSVPYVTSVDSSRFDSCVSVEALCAEHEVYRYFLGDRVDHLLTMQLHTSAVHVCGVFYELDGGRCSGDVNTSLGNWVLNAGIALLFGLGGTMPLYVEGDDVIFGTREPPTGLTEHFLSFGFQSTVTTTRDVMDHVFCGRVLYSAGGRLRSITDLRRTLPKFHLSRHPPGWYTRGLALAKALSYLATDRHCPIIGPVCEAIALRLAGVEPVFDEDWARRLHMGDCQWSVNDEVRAVVDHVFGIPRWRQLVLEEQYEGVSCVEPIAMPLDPLDGFAFVRPP